MMEYKIYEIKTKYDNVRTKLKAIKFSDSPFQIFIPIIIKKELKISMPDQNIIHNIKEIGKINLDWEDIKIKEENCILTCKKCKKEKLFVVVGWRHEHNKSNPFIVGFKLKCKKCGFKIYRPYNKIKDKIKIEER